MTTEKPIEERAQTPQLVAPTEDNTQENPRDSQETYDFEEDKRRKQK